ncbi:hypothetical protein GGX14DRAFT_593297 [Mycena pura]|uniref:Copper amine oxidase catalytic domain-containing protein n=1 Tax=Mycena pura TaxID=153505 RepID=A0AAD6URP7_9AGAR|nr:hypothetical protein GGX14DRAFT_593297 [Mycena pura]
MCAAYTEHGARGARRGATAGRALRCFPPHAPPLATRPVTHGVAYSCAPSPRTRAPRRRVLVRPVAAHVVSRKHGARRTPATFPDSGERAQYLEPCLDVSHRRTVKIARPLPTVENGAGFWRLRVDDSVAGSVAKLDGVVSAETCTGGMSDALLSMDYSKNYEGAYVIVNHDALLINSSARGYAIHPGMSPIHLACFHLDLLTYSCRSDDNIWLMQQGAGATTFRILRALVYHSKRTENNVNFAKHHLAVSLRKESEPSLSSTWNFNLPGAPPVDFYKFFNGESIEQEDLTAWVKNITAMCSPCCRQFPRPVTTNASTLRVPPTLPLMQDVEAETQACALKFSAAASILPVRCLTPWPPQHAHGLMLHRTCAHHAPHLVPTGTSRQCRHKYVATEFVGENRRKAPYRPRAASACSRVCTRRHTLVATH